MITYMRAWISLKFSQIQPLVSMVTDRVMMGKTVSPLFLGCFSTVPFCPPPFRRKAEGHSFRHSVRPSVRPSFRPPNIVGTLCAQLLLQFYADSFETLQMFLSWSEDMHVVWILS